MDGKRFLPKDDASIGVTIFATREALILLGRCTSVLGDGTFKATPEPYDQLCLIFGDFDEYTLPLVYSYMNGKSAPHYRFLLQTLKRKSNSRPEKVVTDYERGMITANETDLPDTQHLGCHFHFSQAIFRKIQELGLQHEYSQNNQLQHAIRMIMATAYLPPAQVCPKMADFCSRPTTQLLVSLYPGFAEILRYFHRTWVCTFPISTWNVFDRNKKMRTTNACEGWNISWYRKNNRTRPIFWDSKRFQELQERETRNKIAHLNCGRAPALEKKKWRKYNSQILALKNFLALGNRSVGSYWDTMAPLCNTF